MPSSELAQFIVEVIKRDVAEADTVTGYRDPLIDFADAGDPRFRQLREDVEPTHLLPEELLPGPRSVVSFFLPFEPWVVEANARQRKPVAREWAVAYVETNALIGRITSHLITALAERDIRAAGEPVTDNFDPETLISRWSHKSVAVISGLGSFGLHRMVITDAGCAGRFGSLVVDADLPVSAQEPRERCLYFHDGSCRACVTRCPVDALTEGGIDKQCCWNRCLEVAEVYKQVGKAEACGKCAIGPCSFESAVPENAG
jgi:epoxyqueuosine reductase QueG